MEKLNGLIRDIIEDKVYNFTSNLNDDELDYAIECMLFWKKEREIQNETYTIRIVKSYASGGVK